MRPHIGIGLPILLMHIIQAAPQSAEPLILNEKQPDTLSKLEIARRVASTSTIFETNENGVPTTTITVLTLLTPFPSAQPIPITSQSQLVTSFIAVPIACPYAPQSSPSAVLFPNSSGLNNSPTAGSILNRQQLFSASRPYYPNASYPAFPTAPPQQCTYYSPTITPVCATVLFPLAALPIPVTACDQSVTFSTDHGYTLAPPAPTSMTNATSVTGGSTVQTITSYYVAPWQVVLMSFSTETAEPSWTTTSSGLTVEVGMVTSAPTAAVVTSGSDREWSSTTTFTTSTSTITKTMTISRASTTAGEVQGA